MKVGMIIALVMFSLTAVESASSPQALTTDYVLAKMEQANKEYPYIQATVAKSEYTSRLNTLSDPQIGKIWISHTGIQPRQIRMEFDKPQEEITVVDKGFAIIYTPNSKTAEKFEFDKEYQQEGECVMFGLCQSEVVIKQNYNLVIKDPETIGGVKTTVLELSPKDAKRANLFSTIRLWLDSAKWVVIQTRRVERNGNYGNYLFTDISTKNFSNSVFKLDTKNATITSRKFNP